MAGIAERLLRERRAAWERWYRPMARARWASAAWHTAGWAVFGAGYVGAVVFVAFGLDASPGEVVLVLVAGSRLSAYITDETTLVHGRSELHTLFAAQLGARYNLGLRYNF